MAGSLNQVQIIGNLTRDPEARTFDNGGKVCNVGVATNRTWNDRDGNRQEKVQYHNVVIRNDRLVETAEKYLKKGDKVFFQGELETRSYKDKDGNDRTTTEIIIPPYTGVMTMLGGTGGQDAAAYDSADRGSRGGNDRGGSRDGGDRGGKRPWRLA